MAKTKPPRTRIKVGDVVTNGYLRMTVLALQNGYVWCREDARRPETWLVAALVRVLP